MTRMQGYLLPEDNPDRQVEAARYATHSAGLEAPIAPTRVCCLATRTLETDGLHIGVTGRPVYGGEPVFGGSKKSALEKMATRYREAGIRVLDNLECPFALAILDPVRSAALIAVDRMGIERLTYVARADLLAFSDSAHVVARFPEVDGRVRNQALYDFLFMHMVPAPETIYEGVYKLPPATALILENGRTHLEHYWSPSYRYAGHKDFETLQSDLRSGLGNAVRASGLDDRTGAFLSGGLDSSSVAGTLAEISDTPVRTFTVGFGEADYDELKFARIANSHFGCEAFEYQMSAADIVDAFPRIATAYDEPFGNSSAAPTYFCARLAAENGVTHLLAGDGGDELFGGNERYVKQSIFELYYRIPGFLREGLLEPLASRVSTESRIMPLRKMRSYVDQALIPLPERFESWNFMYREGGTHMLDRDFAAAIDRDGPMRLMRKVWESAPNDDLLERMLWYDWRFTLADNDLRKVGTMCDLAGIRVSYPMLHHDVIELSTRVPPGMKIRGSELRTFFKRAMDGFLPPEIINKKKHGFGLPFGMWLKSDKALGDLIYSHLPDFKKRGIVDASFIDDLISQHRYGHASYFGYAIWDLAMLEAWMAHHVD